MKGRFHFDVPLCLEEAFSIFDALSWSYVTSQHRSSSSTIKSMPSSCTNASSMTTSAAVRLSPLSCLKSRHLCRFFCNDEVAKVEDCVSIVRVCTPVLALRSLKVESCPNRGPTAVSSSTLSHCLAMVSSHAGLRYQLGIFRLRVLHKIDSIVTL